MGCVLNKCIQDASVQPVAEPEKLEQSTERASQQTAVVIVCHQQKGRLHYAKIAGHEEAVLDPGGRVESRLGEHDLQRNSGDVIVVDRKGTISANIGTARRHGKFHFSRLEKSWPWRKREATKERSARKEASVKTSIADHVASSSGSRLGRREESWFGSPLAWDCSEESTANSGNERLVSSDRTLDNCEAGPSRSDDGGFLRPLGSEVRDVSSDDVLRVHNHDVLWELLSASPGWTRDVHEGHGRSVEGWVEYQIRVVKHSKRARLPTVYRLPWPYLYAASTDLLCGFVEMVNKRMGSNVFELRISNDRPPGLRDDLVDFPRVTTKSTPTSPENDIDGYETRSTCAASGDFSRTTMEGSPRSETVPAVFRSKPDGIGSHLPTSSPIRREAEEEQCARPTEKEEKASQRVLHSTEALEQDPSTAPPDLFANIRKPGLRPPPVFFGGKSTPKPLAEPVEARGKPKAVSTSAPAARICNDFAGDSGDSGSSRRRRGQLPVTFATPYQSPSRGKTSTYVRDENSDQAVARKQDLVPSDFLASMMRKSSRLTL